MADFNSDNAKIDATLKELETKCSLQVIWSHTVTESAETEVNIPCGNINWAEWKCVHLLVDPRQQPGGFSITIILPGGVNFNFMGVSTGILHLMAWPMYDGSRPFRGLYWNAEPSLFSTDKTFSDIQTLRLKLTNNDYPFGTGALFALYGERG